ncbi:MAG TPA: cobalamin-dependent protein [Vicinamibacterales bacterium]|jgi:radical SAM superfamily enzyme YgiQ (UPF0313 family)|nr:cobalamin-dependent protein [Vicinamibacterales bacterium]
MPRILLTSVFKPFTVDDEFGSRAINPAELYQNQVTRAQGPFSLRMFHRSWGLMLMQHNISAPCTVLDFPTRERFVEEITTHHYDAIGISGIVVNVGKVREMCRLARLHSPRSTIVVGGHVTAIPTIEGMVDADHIVRGEGVRWLRAFVGEDPDAPIRHPSIRSAFGFRLMGVPGDGGSSATIIPSVGCPLGCNFCTTSAFFGGKGRIVKYLESARDIFDAMSSAERDLKVSSFFVMDENFLLFKRRALELLDLMKAHGKAWSLYVFSSANAIRQYDVNQLVELGIEWIWLGLESAGASFRKLEGADTLSLTRELQAHGICVLGSTIIGLEHHTPGNIGDHIAHAVSHGAAFHQFMLYTPMPGTELYREMQAAGRLIDDTPLADVHGQFGFNFRHASLERGDAKRLLDSAFAADYDTNGPSLYRLTRIIFDRWKRYRAAADERVRARVGAQARQLRRGYGAALWAMEAYLRSTNASVSGRIRALRLEMERDLGGLTGTIDRAVGPFLLWSARREHRLFPAGRPLEPRTFVDRRRW